MKKATFNLIIVVIILGAFAIQQYFAYIGPKLADKKAIENQILEVRLKQEQLDAEKELFENQLRREIVTNTFPYVILFVFFSGGAIVAIFLWIRYDKRKEAWARPIDGTYALQDVRRNGITWRVDPNKSPSGAFAITDKGALLQAPIDEGFGPDRQLSYNKSIQTTRTATAVSQDGQGFKYAATGKFLAGAYEKPERMISVSNEPEQEEQEYSLMSINEAITQSNKNKWIVGQSKLTGNISALNIRDVIHIGIIGASNTGKTSSTGLLTTYYARKSGYHVIVLDAKGMLDWEPYNKWFEVHKTNGEVFKEQFRSIARLYQERKEQMNKLGLSNFYEGKHNLEPILIVLEEFGSLCDELKNTPDYNQLIHLISRIMRDSRAVGLHFLFIDQEISRWDKVIRSLIKYWIGYKIEASGGHAIGMYKVSGLADVGEFASSSAKNDKFTAWYTKEQLSFDNLKNITHRYLPDIKVEAETSIQRFLADDKKEIQPTEPVLNVHYDDLTEEEKDMLVHFYETTNSFRQTTQMVWGEGKYGKFYNDILRKVLNEYEIEHD